MDTAGQYAEYRVIKTNQRGKRQARIFGIDRHRIYNKTQPGGGPLGDGGGDDLDTSLHGGAGGGASHSGVLSFISRALSHSVVGDLTSSGVSRAVRDISTIASVHVVAQRPKCFCIAFKESSARDAKVAQTREYELETKMVRGCEQSAAVSFRSLFGLCLTEKRGLFCLCALFLRVGMRRAGCATHLPHGRAREPQRPGTRRPPALESRHLGFSHSCVHLGFWHATVISVLRKHLFEKRRLVNVRVRKRKKSKKEAAQAAARKRCYRSA